jgi:membrane-associated phospholipid phosphatase
MTPESVAHFAGPHGVVLFSAAAIAMLALTCLAWRFIERHGESLQQRIVYVVKRLLHLIDKRLLRGRLATIEPGEYLVMHVVVGFVVMFVALAGFFELTEALSIDDELGQFDQALAQALRANVDENTYRFFSMVTQLGDMWLLTAISVVIALALIARRQWLLLAGWLAAVVGNGLLTRALKALFQRLRPLHDNGFATADGWSFPSGHSSGSLVVYGMLAYLAIRAVSRQWHLPVVLTTIALILTALFQRRAGGFLFWCGVAGSLCCWYRSCVAKTLLML